MAVYHAQISFPMDSGLPKDVITINPHYNGSDAQALADRLKSNLMTTPNILTTKPFTVKIYDAKKAPPSFPLATASQTGTTPNSSHPRELALCLSYYAQWNRPGFRGRVYIPLEFIGGVPDVRPSTTQRDSTMAWKTTLTGGLPSGTFMVVYSRKNGTDAQVTNFWVDDEWDIVRSRGLRGTARTLG